MKTLAQILVNFQGKTGELESYNGTYLMKYGPAYEQHHYQDMIKEIGEDYVLITSGQSGFRYIPLNLFVLVNESK